jgi:uncharacterized cupin superfamily protein
MTSAVTITPHLSDVAAVSDLEDWGPLAEASDPGTPMHTSGHTLWTGEGDQEVGIWECTPGPSHWTLETNEQIYLLTGRMTCTPTGGSPVELRAGDAAVFPVGWSGDWQIHETVRKLYVIF